LAASISVVEANFTELSAEPFRPKESTIRRRIRRHTGRCQGHVTSRSDGFSMTAAFRQHRETHLVPCDRSHPGRATPARLPTPAIRLSPRRWRPRLAGRRPELPGTRAHVPNPIRRRQQTRGLPLVNLRNSIRLRIGRRFAVRSVGVRTMALLFAVARARSQRSSC